MITLLEFYKNLLNSESLKYFDEFGEFVETNILCFTEQIQIIEQQNISGQVRLLITENEVIENKNSICGICKKRKINIYLYENGFVDKNNTEQILQKVEKIVTNIFQTSVNEKILIVDTKSNGYKFAGNDNNNNKVYVLDFEVKTFEE